MSWAGSVISLAGGIMGASGTAAAGRDAQEAYDINAAIARQNAELAREAADADILSLKRGAYKIIGAQRAGYGASGVSGDSGSALDVLAESTALAVLDQQNRKYQGELEARDFLNQAAQGVAAGSAARDAAQTSASAQMLSSLGNTANQLYTPPAR